MGFGCSGFLFWALGVSLEFRALILATVVSFCGLGLRVKGRFLIFKGGEGGHDDGVRDIGDGLCDGESR